MTPDMAEILLPSLVSIAVAVTLVTGYALGSEGALRAIRMAYRTHQENARLREELVAERAPVARVTAGTDEILAAARGAHHRKGQAR